MSEITEVSAVLASLVKSGRLTRQDKRWVSKKLDEQRSHEFRLVLTKAMGDNPDLPFILMFLGGTVGATLTSASDTDAGLPSWAENVLDISSFMTLGLTGWVAQEAALASFTQPATSWQDYACKTVNTLSTSVAVFAASILVARAFFGTSKDGGGLQQLAGLASMA